MLGQAVPVGEYHLYFTVSTVNRRGRRFLNLKNKNSKGKPLQWPIDARRSRPHRDRLRPGLKPGSKSNRCALEIELGSIAAAFPLIVGPIDKIAEAGWQRAAAAEKLRVRCKIAQNTVLHFKSVVDEFIIKERRLPGGWVDLRKKNRQGFAYIEGLTEDPRDPWDSVYEIRKSGLRHDYAIVSHGPDRKPNTADDISSRRRR